MNLAILGQFSAAEYYPLARAYVIAKVSPQSLPPEGDRGLVAANLFGHAIAMGWSLRRVGNINQIRLSESGTELNFQIRRRTTDANVFSQVFRYMEYGPVVTLYRKKFGQQAAHIIDAGGNAGFASLYFGAHFPKAKIVTLEIEAGNYMAMTANFKSNPALNIVPQLRGLWYNNDVLSVNTSFRAGGEYAFSVLPNDDVAKDLDQHITGMTVQDIVAEHFGGQMIDILKIDIEGAEKYLFQDEALALEFLAMTKFLALEIHDDVADRQHIRQILAKANMDWIDEQETTVAWHR
jgi:FkbM family methyltransferase